MIPCSNCGKEPKSSAETGWTYYFDEFNFKHKHNADCLFGKDCGGQVRDDYTRCLCPDCDIQLNY